MKQNKKTAQEREKFHNLHGLQKVQYIWDYYKLPLVVLLILFYVTGYLLYRHFTHKETILYTALVNITAGETLTTQLDDGFLEHLKANTAKENLRLYTGLYLTDDKSSPFYGYNYTSQVKILAAIESKQMDVVLMDQEAFNTFSQNGYLCDLEKLLSASDSELAEKLKSCLVTNTVSAAGSETIGESPVGLDMLALDGPLKEAGFKEHVYLGIIENSPRKELSVDYIKYLGTAQN